MNSIDQLCPNCGLCCDGSLFADVELRADDDAKRLAQLGVLLAKKSRQKIAFVQPCACFDRKYCKIYDDRPRQCRLFECGVLKKAGTGKITVDAALKTISDAKLLANKVRALLRAFRQCPDEQALTLCYSEAMNSPVDLSHDDVGKRHSELMQAFGDLMTLIERDFLQ